MSDLKIENYLNEGFNMKTIIRVDEEYKIIERRVFDEKPIPNKIIDLIIPILKKGREMNVTSNLQHSRCSNY